MTYPYQKILPLEFENPDSNPLLTESYKTLGTLHSVLCRGIEFTSKNQFPIVEPYSGDIPESLLRELTPICGVVT